AAPAPGVGGPGRAASASRWHRAAPAAAPAPGVGGPGCASAASRWHRAAPAARVDLSTGKVRATIGVGNDTSEPYRADPGVLGSAAAHQRGDLRTMTVHPPDHVSPFATEVPVIELTSSALEMVLDVRNAEDDPDALALRIEITGSRGPEFVYDLSFDELALADADDLIVEAGGVPVIVPAATVERLRGSVLDLPRVEGQGGLVIRNPNRPDPLEGVTLNLEGTMAEQVEQLLEQAINPSLAAHGGFAQLVGVDDDSKAYVTLGGGCQGCSMSRMTLAQGIQRQILDAIPGVTEVIDATDHTAGENPFYR
ncbi:MAG TPA: NifU family protein, partial [Microthrixaceae bacterium]|nr:NifU family protein [Microthrixaceae bacterium]